VTQSGRKAKPPNPDSMRLATRWGWDGTGFFSQRIETILSNKTEKFLFLPSSK